MQNLLLSEKRTLDHWATVQFFFSLAQVRCFWRCFCFRSGLVALFLKTSERGDFWCTDSTFSPLLVKLSQVFESALLDSQACGYPCCLCIFSYPISSFQSTLHLLCFDTALCEQPPLSVMIFWDLHSLWSVSMIVFWRLQEKGHQEIRCAKTLATFKSRLKTHLFSCAFVEWAQCYVRTDCTVFYV